MVRVEAVPFQVGVAVTAVTVAITVVIESATPLICASHTPLEVVQLSDPRTTPFVRLKVTVTLAFDTSALVTELRKVTVIAGRHVLRPEVSDVSEVELM